MIYVDDRTRFYELPLPNVANDISDDIFRISTAFNMLDTDLKILNDDVYEYLAEMDEYYFGAMVPGLWFDASINPLVPNAGTPESPQVDIHTISRGSIYRITSEYNNTQFHYDATAEIPRGLYFMIRVEGMDTVAYVQRVPEDINPQPLGQGSYFVFKVKNEDLLDIIPTNTISDFISDFMNLVLNAQGARRMLETPRYTTDKLYINEDTLNTVVTLRTQNGTNYNYTPTSSFVMSGTYLGAALYREDTNALADLVLNLLKTDRILSDSSNSKWYNAGSAYINNLYVGTLYNYVTTNTNQTISGCKTFAYQQNGEKEGGEIHLEAVAPIANSLDGKGIIDVYRTSSSDTNPCLRLGISDNTNGMRHLDIYKDGKVKIANRASDQTVQNTTGNNEVVTVSFVNSKINTIFQVVNSLPASPDPNTFYFIPQ